MWSRTTNELLRRNSKGEFYYINSPNKSFKEIVNNMNKYTNIVYPSVKYYDTLLPRSKFYFEYSTKYNGTYIYAKDSDNVKYYFTLVHQAEQTGAKNRGYYNRIIYINRKIETLEDGKIIDKNSANNGRITNIKPTQQIFQLHTSDIYNEFYKEYIPKYSTTYPTSVDITKSLLIYGDKSTEPYYKQKYKDFYKIKPEDYYYKNNIQEKLIRKCISENSSNKCKTKDLSDYRNLEFDYKSNLQPQSISLDNTKLQNAVKEYNIIKNKIKNKDKSKVKFLTNDFYLKPFEFQEIDIGNNQCMYFNRFTNSLLAINNTGNDLGKVYMKHMTNSYPLPSDIQGQSIEKPAECIFKKRIIREKSAHEMCCDCGGGEITQIPRKLHKFVSHLDNINTTKTTIQEENNKKQINSIKLEKNIIHQPSDKLIVYSQTNPTVQNKKRYTAKITIKTNIFQSLENKNTICRLQDNIDQPHIRVSHKSSIVEGCNTLSNYEKCISVNSNKEKCDDLVYTSILDKKNNKKINTLSDTCYGIINHYYFDESENKYKYFLINISGVDWSKYSTKNNSKIYIQSLDEYKSLYNCVDITNKEIYKKKPKRFPECNGGIYNTSKGGIDNKKDCNDYKNLITDNSKLKIAKFRVYNEKSDEEINIIVWNNKWEEKHGLQGNYEYEYLLARFDPWDRTIINWPEIGENDIDLLIMDQPLDEKVYDLKKDIKPIIATYTCIDSDTENSIKTKYYNNDEFVKTNLTLEHIIKNNITLFSKKINNSISEVISNPIINKGLATSKGAMKIYDMKGGNTNTIIYDKLEILVDKAGDFHTPSIESNSEYADKHIYNKSTHFRGSPWSHDGTNVKTSSKTEKIYDINFKLNDKIKIISIFSDRGWKNSYNSIYNKNLFKTGNSSELLSDNNLFYHKLNSDNPDTYPVTWIRNDYLYKNIWNDKFENSLYYRNFFNWRFEEVDIIQSEMYSNKIFEDIDDNLITTTLSNKVYHSLDSNKQYIIKNKKFTKSNTIYSDYNNNNISRNDIQLSLYILKKNINKTVPQTEIQTHLITRLSNTFNYNDTLLDLFQYNLNTYFNNYDLNVILCTNNYAKNSFSNSSSDLNKWIFTQNQSFNQGYTIKNSFNKNIGLSSTDDIYQIIKQTGNNSGWYVIKDTATNKYLRAVSIKGDNSNVFIKLQFSQFSKLDDSFLFSINESTIDNVLYKLPSSNNRQDLQEISYNIQSYIEPNLYLNTIIRENLEFISYKTPSPYIIQRLDVDENLKSLYQISDNDNNKFKIITEYIPFYSSNYDTYIIRDYYNKDNILTLNDSNNIIWMNIDDIQIINNTSKKIVERSLWKFDSITQGGGISKQNNNIGKFISILIVISIFIYLYFNN